VLLASCSTGQTKASIAPASGTSTTTPVIFYDRSWQKETFMSQVAMDQCAGKEVAELEGQLSRALNKDAAVYGATAVHAVQSSWIKFRDFECSLEGSDFKGGTIQPLIYEECEIRPTVQRLQQVREALAGLPHAGP
jgi:uncharacterized protein YecT (DUF1311 family)